MEFWQMNYQTAGVTFRRPGALQSSRELMPGVNTFTTPTRADTITVPPRSSVEVTDKTDRLPVGQALVAWWQPPLAGPIRSSRWDRFRFRLASAIHHPSTIELHSRSGPTGWRARLADLIRPNLLKPVASEPFIILPVEVGPAPTAGLHPHAEPLQRGR